MHAPQTQMFLEDLSEQQRLVLCMNDPRVLFELIIACVLRASAARRRSVRVVSLQHDRVLFLYSLASW